MSQLDVLRSVSFDWTMHLTSVWSDPPFDVPALHADIRRELEWKLDQLVASPESASPLGWVVVGSGGTGKTHLLSVLRHQARQRGISFVLVDMTDVHDFWETVLQGFTTSLQQPTDDDRFQYQVLLERLFSALQVKDARAQVEALTKKSAAQLNKLAGQLLSWLKTRQPAETLRHQDSIRALIALNSDNFDVSSIGMTWLQGFEIDDSDRRALGFTRGQQTPIEIIRALSWVMSLFGPTVIALDQLDPIVTQLNVATRNSDSESNSEELRVARSIIEKLAGGLSALRDVTRRTLSVVSCVETTHEVLTKLALTTNMDRFEPPRKLHAVPQGQIARDVVQSRLTPVFRAKDFSPPWPTWPFASEAFDQLKSDVSPRLLLKLCYEHQLRCLRDNSVTVLQSFNADAGEAVVAPLVESHRLDPVFARYCQEAPVESLLDEKRDD